VTTRSILVRAVALVVFAVAWQGSRPLWEPDEGRYTAVAIQMLESGEWLVPHLHPDVEHLTKPPLTYWTVAGAMAWLGRTEWAVRLPNAAAFAATVLLVTAIAGTLGGRSPTAAGVVYATSLGPFVASNVLTPDTLLTLWVAASLLGVVRAWTADDDRIARRWAIAAWLAAGLAFLTKGPPGLLVPAAAAVAVMATDGRRAVRRLLPPAGPLVFTVVGLGWYAAVAVDRPGLLSQLVRDEVIGRLFSGHHRRGAGWSAIFTVYLPTLLLGSMPWLPAAGLKLARARDLVRPAAWTRRRQDRATTFVLLAAAAAPLLVFVVARSRQPLYLLPLFVPVAVLLARTVRWPPRPAGALALVVWAVMLLSLRAAGPLMPTDRSARAFAQELRSLVPHPIDEVVVVNDVNRFGLVFELGCDVEHVALEPADLEPHVSYRTRMLADEVDLPHGHRVYLVPRHSLGRFRREIGRLGVEVVESGRVGKMFVFRRDGGARSG
jgi:4-amino-4-deoxy-L-arabinose transferase